MKTNDVLKRKEVEGLFALSWVLFLWFILPRFGDFAVMVGCAVGFAAQVYLFPDRFRGRSGSLKLAFCLIGFLALAAAVVGVLSLIGGR
jgi:hypothetical protein